MFLLMKMRVLGLLVCLILNLLVISCQVEASACGSCHLSRAVCVNGSCDCSDPDYPWGNNPCFRCYGDDEIATEIMNDPTLYDFNRKSVPFPFPCRFMLTHFNSDLLKNGIQNGVCEVMVHGFIAKSKGKFFVHGFDVALRIVLDHSVLEYTHRIYGIANNTVLDHEIKATEFAFFPNGTNSDDCPDYTDVSNGINIQAMKEAHSGNLVYQLDGCGVKIELTPYDESLRQEQLPHPGLSVAIKKHRNISFLSSDVVMGLGHTSYPGGDTFSATKLTNLTVPESVISRAFTNVADVTQSQPFSNLECMYGLRAQDDCIKAGPELRRLAFKNCFWMLQYEKYIRCMDEDTYVPYGLLFNFNNCLSSWCSDRYSCDGVVAAIEDRRCDDIPSITPLVDFIAGKMCPEEDSTY